MTSLKKKSKVEITDDKNKRHPTQYKGVCATKLIHLQINNIIWN